MSAETSQPWVQVIHAEHEPRCNRYCDGTEHYLGRKHLDVQPTQVCGYEGEGHDLLIDHGWTAHAWRTPGGYGGGRGGRGDENRHKERIYFSPHCEAAEAGLFDLTGGVA